MFPPNSVTENVLVLERVVVVVVVWEEVTPSPFVLTLVDVEVGFVPVVVEVVLTVVALSVKVTSTG